MNPAIFSDRIDTPLGAMMVCASEGKLVSLEFDDKPGWVLKNLERRFPEFELHPTSNPFGYSDRVRAYFNGELGALDDIPTEPGGTSFERRVWAELRRIPCGKTMSYGKLAERLGDVKASRAVGLANGRNPIAIAVPCHRVIGADGTLIGYGGGLDRKAWLLSHEGIPVRNGRLDPQPDLFE
jgi:methylated-DNA-[protein]-cysteine S-methyltransferase